ncbi:ABC transporter permease [Streptomyces sp. NPDC001941]|uniref:ABC transporter permease n=1 Tax=Streptomyces sp. NPDC001941 TaxID=3154659 RepID=UPI00331DC395
MTAKTVAPWVRTRLRTAPGAACALAVLVLLTAFLAAALPRAVDAYETEGLRRALDTAAPSSTTLQLFGSTGSVADDGQSEAVLRPQHLARGQEEFVKVLPEPLRADVAQSSRGVRTADFLPVPRPFRTLLPKMKPPMFRLYAQQGVPEHSTLAAGRMPVASDDTTGATTRIEAAVTTQTAKDLRITPGTVLEVPGQRGPLVVTVTGVVAPRDPAGAYWATEPVTRTPALVLTKDLERFWQAVLLVPPAAGPALRGASGSPETYWNLPPDTSSLTPRDLDALGSAVTYVQNGPGLLDLQGVVGQAGLRTDLGLVLDRYSAVRDAIGPVVAVAAVGVGAVALVVLSMAGGLAATRRRAELALLRSRGGSLAGIGGRLLAEIAVITLPATAAGLGLALWLVGPARTGPALLAALAVALVATTALPLRAVVAHRRPPSGGAREDVVHARPSRRRTVAELTLLVLALGAVVALRRRGATDAGDLLVSAAPVLVGTIAAFLLVRLYPLPLRLAARPVARLRGAIGFLSLARAGRTATTGALPLLALLIALTTAAFGGSVLAGVADTRDRAATLATGSDARVSGPNDAFPLPKGLAEKVRSSPGVRSVVTVQVEYGVELAKSDVGGDSTNITLVGVDPASYDRLSRDRGLGSVPPDLLASTGKGGVGPDGEDAKRVLPALASPGAAAAIGSGTRALSTASGEFRVKVAGVRTGTPAVPAQEFLVVNEQDLTHRVPTVLLAGGDSIDAAALRANVKSVAPPFAVTLWAEERAAFTDSPMQSGAERIYTAAIAAGAGYAVLALLLSLLGTAAERTTLLARLRTMGLTTRQGRRLLGLEALPQTLLAAAGGVAVGWATIELLSPGVNLGQLALAAASDGAAVRGLPLRADAWSLAVPAAAVVAIAAAVAMTQAWWVARRGSINELRAGDSR